jgi:DnaJ-class molecular chaperone
VIAVATRKTTARKPRAKKCPDCNGAGEIAENVRVGSARKPRQTADQQAALCLTCFGSGDAPTN